ncbi:MAG: hypothetical protein Q7R33_02890 [Nitrosarchaeum sp.]|nr:hypothetical protein [Nitrosarchaeum sp.]
MNILNRFGLSPQSEWYNPVAKAAMINEGVKIHKEMQDRIEASEANRKIKFTLEDK